jgi:hypothetical protein
MLSAERDATWNILSLYLVTYSVFGDVFGYIFSYYAYI